MSSKLECIGVQVKDRLDLSLLSNFNPTFALYRQNVRHRLYQ